MPFYFLFHVPGISKTIIGNNSKRPANMLNIKTNFENGEKMEKFCVGPTISNPGPMLFNVATTAVKFVVKLKLYTLITKVESNNIEQYIAKKTCVFRTVSCSIT